MSIENEKIKNIIEAALFAADNPLSIDKMLALFDVEEQPERADIKEVLESIEEEYEKRGIELKLVSSGYRFQVRQQFSPWVSKLWEEKPPRYTKALLETLALITYRQPITRAEIEDVRGVAVSSNIIKTLQERDWIKMVGHRDVPGRPALFATTKTFLDYFNMKSMDELPTLAEIKELHKIPDNLGQGADANSDLPTGSNLNLDLNNEEDQDIDAEIEQEGEIQTQNEYADADAINDFDEETGSVDIDNESNDCIEDDVDDDSDENDDSDSTEFSAVGDGDISDEPVVDEPIVEGTDIDKPLHAVDNTVDGKTVEDVVVNSISEESEESIKKSASSDYPEITEGRLLN